MVLAIMTDREYVFEETSLIYMTDFKQGITRILENKVFYFPDRNYSNIIHPGGKRSIDSGKVNNYIREICTGDFTAKDFRIWAGTLLFMKYLAETENLII